MTVNEPGRAGSGDAPQGGFTAGAPVIGHWGDLESVLRRGPLVDAVPAEQVGVLFVLAIAIGVLAQLLFVGQGIGINAVMWTALIIGAAGAARRRGTPFDVADAWLPPAALVTALMLAIRADPALVAFDAPAMLALTGCSIAALAGIRVTRRSVGGLLSLVVRGGVVATTGAAGMGPGIRSRARDTHGLPVARARPVAIGLLIALPVLAACAYLFAGADAVFARGLSDVLTWQLDLGTLPLRIGVGSVAAWIGAGMLVLVAAAGARIHDDEPFVPPARLGGIEATVALIAIDVLFAVFVALQATYLFGGRDMLSAVGLSYSEYARRGFWELVTVAALVGGLVGILEAVVRERGRAYRVASLLLVALTAVVLASAAFRLGMYQQAYGWTELRFYVLTSIAWLGLCLLAAAVTLATNRSRWLPHAAVLLGLLVAVGANVVGPQSFVVTQNVARAVDPSQVAAGGRPGLDAQYLGGLGDGAVPVLLDALPRLSTADRATVVAALVARRESLRQQSAEQGWPSWNLAREDARSLLQSALLP